MHNIVPFSQTGLEMGALHNAMLAAFSDYVVPLQPNKDAFLSMMASRGFDPEASFVAIDNDEVAAFWNVATRGQKRYLITSGTRIDHRGKGLSSGLGRAAIKSAKDADMDSFWLEVIKGNEGAEKLYEKLGFKVVRALNCYRFEHPSPDLSSCRKTDFETAQGVIKANATWEPTWQNAADTIAGADLTCFLHEKGAAIVGAGGNVHQIAAADRMALGELLAAVATEGSLTFVNVDASEKNLGPLLIELGADQFIRQSEMCFSL